MALTKNIVTNYACPIDGVSDCRPAFLAFKGDAQGLDADLTVPAHAYQFLVNSGPNADYYLFEGIKSLTVHAAGATFSHGAGLASSGFFLGTQGLVNNNLHHARIASVNAGSSSVTVIDGNVSRFTVGRYILISALDLQGAGYPLNPYYWEWALVAGISGATVSLSAPLVHSYLSTFPNYEPGDATNFIDQGGPATIYAMPASWGDADFTFDGLTVTRPGAQTYANGRKVRFLNAVCSNSEGIVPSQNMLHTWDNCDFSICSVEMDKLVSVFDAGNGTTVHQLHFQSSSIDLMTSRGGLTVANGFNGTAKKSVLDSVTSAVSIGPQAYGTGELFIGSNSSISSVAGLGTTDQDVTNAAILRTRATGAFSMSNGVISLSNAAAPIRWAVPGARCMFQGSAESETAFTVLSVTSNGTTTFVQTDLTGTWPNVPLQGGTRLDIMVHPCPILWLTNCTGCDDAIDLSNAGAQGRPLYSYSKRSYTRTTLANPISGPHLWGRINQVKVTEGNVFTTSGALTLKIFGQFSAAALDPNNSATSWNLTVDLKTAGVRTVTASTVTGSAGTDSLSAPGAIWFEGATGPFISGTITAGDPGTVEIETMTNQGISGRAFACSFQ